MINWECKNCRKNTEHHIKQTGFDKYSDYKILICQVCGEKEMAPEHIIEQERIKTDENVNTMKVNWEALESTK